MRPQRSGPAKQFMLPGRRQVVGCVLLITIFAAAIASIRTLPSAMAQQDERSGAVVIDQAEPDRSISIPAVSRQDVSTDPTRVNQVLVPSGFSQPSNQITQPEIGGDRLVEQRLEGADVCDDESGTDRPAVCNRPIEARSAEFAGRTRPQLSAEERILVQQNPDSLSMEASDAAARRLGSNRVSDISSEDLAIASVAIGARGATQTAPEEEASDIPADATGAIDAILGVINAIPPE